MSNTLHIDFGNVNIDWDRLAKIEQQEIKADDQTDPLDNIKQEIIADWKLAHDKGFLLKNFYPDEYPIYLNELHHEARNEYIYDQTHDSYAEYLKSTDRTEYDIYLDEFQHHPERFEVFDDDNDEFDPYFDYLIDKQLYGWD